MELILAGTQVDGAAIPVAVAMEAVAAEATTAEPIAEPVTVTAPGPTSSTASGLVTSTAPEPSAEAWVDPQPEVGSEVVVRKVMIEDVVLFRSAPMPDWDLERWRSRVAG
jgi:hypothetical protein